MDELKRTALFEEHLALGATMQAYDGWELPDEYVSPAEECEAVRQSAGIIDLGHLAAFRVFGFAAFDFMQRLFTNDVHEIAELGEAQRSLLLDDDGLLIDKALVFHTGDLEYMIVSSAEHRDEVLAWMHRHAPEDLELVDESDRTGLLGFSGPKAAAIVAELAPAGFELPERGTIGEAILDTIPTLLARESDTGEDGVMIVCGARNTPALWRAILSFGEVTPVGRIAHRALRLESGHTPFEVLAERVEPVSAGLGWAIPAKRRGYVGEGAVDAVRRRGPERTLAGLTVDRTVHEAGAPVLRGGAVVGKVAVGAFSPSLLTGIATAFLDSDSAIPGTAVEIQTADGVAAATVVELPFVKTESPSH